jgi:hypothetical protein
MSEALGKRYQTVMFGQPEGSELLRTGYDRWLRTHAAAFDQIHRFFTLTNSLPVVGDRLLQTGCTGGDALRIEQRMIFSTDDSQAVLLVYQVCSEEIEDLEEYQQGDVVEVAA